MRIILVPLDGSQLGEQALPSALLLARKAQADIVLLAAVTPAFPWSQQKDERAGEELRWAGRYLRSVQRRLRGLGPRVRTHATAGKPAECITSAADETGAELIVMTTHGRSGLPRLVMGSVANEVVRTSRKPVFLVRAREKPPSGEPQYRRILVPLDGSPLSEAVLPFVEDLALQLGASILLERVVVPPVLLYPAEFVPSNVLVLDDIEAEAKDYLRGIGKGVRRKGITVSQEVSVGYPADTILDAARRRKVDLVAMSSHSRPAPERWVLGSTADAVVRQSDVPCLVVRPSEGRADERAAGEAAEEVAGAVGPPAVVVPPPAWTEVPGQPAQEPEARPRAVRRRPERSPGR